MNLRILTRLLFAYLLIIQYNSIASAQTFDLDWAFEIDGSGGCSVRDIAVDDTGNIYVTGYFNGSPDFDPGTGSYLITSSGTNAFVAKYTNDQQLIWAYRFAGAPNDGHFIELDSSGNIYVAGLFSGIVDFNTSAATFNMNTVGQDDIFVCKLANNGSFLWAKSLGGSEDDFVADIHLTPDGRLFHTGYFWETADLDPGAGVQSVTSYGGLDIYIQVLESNGSLAWAHQIGGGEWDYGDDIIADSLGNVYVACRYWWPVDFDPGPGTATLGASQYASCLAKYDFNGNFVWVKDLGVTGTIDNLCLDSYHQLVISGNFNDPTDFDFGPSTFELIPDATYDHYFGKYTTDGNLIWMKQFIGPGTMFIKEFFLDTSDCIYFYGGFSGVSDFDPGLDTFLMDSGPFSNAFILKTESNGDFIYASNIGNNSGGLAYRGAAVDPNLEIICGGFFYYTTDFDPGGNVFSMTGTSAQDAFLLKLGSCSIPPDPPGDLNPDHINICSGESTTLYSAHLGTLSYYTDLVGGSFIASDNSFTTPILYNTTTYYVQDSTCTASANRTAVTVTVFDLPNIIINANPDFDLCADESLTLTGSGGITYNWNLGVIDGISFMPVDSTTFIVQGTDVNGCVNSDTALITVHDPVISFITLNNTTLSSLTAGNSYQWFDCLAGFTPVAGAIDSTFSPTENGYYALEVTIDGCSDMSSCYQILSLQNSENFALPFTVYPNPTHGFLYIDFLRIGTLELVDLNGKILLQKSITDSDLMIDISNLPTGVYNLIFDTNGERYYSKIVRI